MPEIPEIGSKWKCSKLRGLFTFMGQGQRGDVIWWDFIDTKDGKRHSFYPDEVYPADSKPKRTKKSATKKTTSKMTIENPTETTVTIGGETITII